jgi:CelD/BcsL family acetyltransferase involved in cellulose biosynthesis
VPEADLVDDPAALDELAPAWDALAVAGRLPLCAPAVVAGWWRHVAPSGAALRLAVVRDGGELIGLAPFWVDGRDLRLAGAGVFNRLAPLGDPESAEAIARALAGARADVVLFEATPIEPPWPALLRERWPGRGRPAAFRSDVLSAPVAHLRPSFEEWMGSRSKNFRSQMRRARRDLEQAGGRSRQARPETLRADLDALWRLHVGRWEGREESNLAAYGPVVVDALEAAGRALPAGRFRLWLVEVEGEVAAAHLFVAAGGLVTYWNGGWDERHARLKPALLSILAAVEEACEAGDDLFDLGAGEQAYKQRFADDDSPLAWSGLIVPGPRSLLTRARLAPTLARATTKRVLPEPAVTRLRALTRTRRPGE